MFGADSNTETRRRIIYSLSCSPKPDIMKHLYFIAVLFVLIFIATPGVYAQGEHCKIAMKKEMKSCKKDCKIKKKMFHDQPYRAMKKQSKADKKECKADKKEFFHHMDPNHDNRGGE